MPVSRLLAYYRLDLDRMVVVHDELDIDPGQIRSQVRRWRQRPQRTPVDPRLARRGRRLLPGPRRRRRPPGRQDPADFLLSNFPASARESVAVEVDRAADAVESLVTVGLERTQNLFNS